MFSRGDMIVYGSVGVCRVSDVQTMSLDSADQQKNYYILRPLNVAVDIMIPTDTDIFMRPVISASEAKRLIEKIPDMQAALDECPTQQILEQCYSNAIDSHDCRDLMESIMVYFAKKRACEKNSQKFGVTNEKCYKRALALLQGEFSVALGIPQEEVELYISAQVENNVYFSCI